MTSKQALEHLKIASVSNDKCYPANYGLSPLEYVYADDIKIIEKDLEMLEFLKEHISLCPTTAKNFDEAYMLLEPNGSEGFKKIKGWLKNE